MPATTCPPWRSQQSYGSGSTSNKCLLGPRTQAGRQADRRVLTQPPVVSVVRGWKGKATIQSQQRSSLSVKWDPQKSDRILETSRQKHRREQRPELWNVSQPKEEKKQERTQFVMWFRVGAFSDTEIKKGCEGIHRFLFFITCSGVWIQLWGLN